MRHHMLLGLGLLACCASIAGAATFDRVPIAPELGLDVLNRSVTRTQLGRELFAEPWATVTLSRVDVYDAFPYVESRTFHVVSDPRWNRLIFGEAGRSLRAFDGTLGGLGRLSAPRGLAVDEFDRVYVADTGNDRIVVLQARSEFGEMELQPLFAIAGLHAPHAVAYSDAGTPFEAGDDRLYVADTGDNAVLAFRLLGNTAQVVARVGGLGSGPGRFAGPMALAVGRNEGHTSHDLFVADAHSRRLIRLDTRSDALAWAGEVRHEADMVTSLECDPWGNVYAVAPGTGRVSKYSPRLESVAVLDGALHRPRAFHMPVATISDHRDGRVRREAVGQAVSLESWGEQSGLKRWTLGLEIADLRVEAGAAPRIRFRLTDAAHVAFDIVEPIAGRVVSSRTLGSTPAGEQVVEVPIEALGGVAAEDLAVRVRAGSRYAGGPSASAQAAFHWSGGMASAPALPVLLGAWPNPSRGDARLAFVLPRATTGPVALRLLDAQGREVRRWAGSGDAGQHEVRWDGLDQRGHAVSAGVYFARLMADGVERGQRVVFVR